MWIKSLDADTWVNVNHITHFIIYQSSNEVYYVRTYFDATGIHISGEVETGKTGQASLRVYRGTRGKCVWFIRWNRFRAWLSRWIGYLAAGTVGAIITYLLGLLNKVSP